MVGQLCGVAQPCRPVGELTVRGIASEVAWRNRVAMDNSIEELDAPKPQKIHFVCSVTALLCVVYFYVCQLLYGCWISQSLSQGAIHTRTDLGSQLQLCGHGTDLHEVDVSASCYYH